MYFKNYGFTLVEVDGSSLSFEENIAICMVEAAHAVNVSAEREMGTMET